jgi:hypothetical protein
MVLTQEPGENTSADAVVCVRYAERSMMGRREAERLLGASDYELNGDRG